LVHGDKDGLRNFLIRDGLGGGFNVNKVGNEDSWHSIKKAFPY
jgi:hypothetical protein